MPKNPSRRKRAAEKREAVNHGVMPFRYGEVKGGWDAETIAELTAEYRLQTNVRGYTVTRWHKRSGRPDHRLDCAVYSLAALALSRLKIDDCDLQPVEARNVGKLDGQEKNRERSPFGAQKMFVESDPAIGDLAGYGVELPPGRPRPAGWGALPRRAATQLIEVCQVECFAARELRNCGDENQRALRSKSTCASKTTSVHKYGYAAATLSASRNRFLPRNCRSLVSTSAAAVCLKSKRAFHMWMTRHFSIWQNC